MAERALFTTPTDYFQQVAEAYRRAEQTAGCIERFYRLGTYTLRLRFAGPVLIPYVTPAFAHLAVSPATPDLTVYLCDTSSTRTALPAPPWPKEAYLKNGYVLGYNDGRIRTQFHLDAGALNLLDTEQAQGIYWARTASELPDYEIGAPLRIIISWWVATRGCQMIHAGAIGRPGGGVLLAGKGGAGKSNTALASLASDLFYASDDYCLLAPEPVPTVFSIYSTGKTHAADLQRLPFLASIIGNPGHVDHEKALFFLHAHFPTKLIRCFPLRALLIPHITGNVQTTCTPASPAEGLRALAPSSIVLVPIWSDAIFHMIARVVRNVPAYHLHLGGDAQAISPVIANLLDQLERA